MLEYFTKNTNLQEGALDFFRIHLGFSVKEYTKKSFTAAQIFGSQFKDSPSFKAVEAGFVVGMVDDNSLKKPHLNSPDLYDQDGVTELNNKPKDYPAIFLYAIELTPELKPKRGLLAELTRALNIEYKGAPVVVIFRYGEIMALATNRRSNYKVKHKQGEKIGKVSILLDININQPHPGHQQILYRLKPETKAT
ncbi:MAG TPA: hypothetical protein PK509_17565, partial [Catalimonadaceae bacterium]|nr:hypothetical protein [Catalimonadaceae bacterium]